MSSLAYAQFNKGIGTVKDQEGHSVQRTKVDPGFIAAGQDGLSVFGATEASIVKTKPDGTPQWSMVYGGVGNETFNSIREIYKHNTVAIDGYAVLGTTTSFASTEDLYFVRTDLSGIPLFSFTFGRREGNERGHCLQYINDFATGKLGYIMVGQAGSYNFFGDSTDILVVKTDESGTLTGAKVIGGHGEDIAYWVEQTRDGEFVITGSTTSSINATSKDIFVIRLDKNLNIVWQAIYINPEVFSDDVGYSIVENPLDGSFTVTGFTASFGLGNSQDAFLLNLKSDGSVNWMRTYGTNRQEQAHSLDLSSGGKEYVVAGFAVDTIRGIDAWVFKTDMFGNPIWSNLYRASSDSTETANEITNDGGNGYIFTGKVESPLFTTNNDYYLVNLDVNGKTGACQNEFTKAWEKHGPSIYKNFQAVDVKDIRVACTQYENANYIARKCFDRISSELTPPTAPTEVITVSPNPTSSSIKVLFQDVDSKADGGMIAVFDRNGKIVYKGEVNSDEIQIPVEGLPNDLYMVRFTTRDGKQYQKKFIKK
jgi:hypothetical protein